MCHICKILNVKWSEFISNEKVLAQASLSSMNKLLDQKNLRWTGHVQEMENTRLPKQKLYSQLEDVSQQAKIEI